MEHEQEHPAHISSATASDAIEVTREIDADVTAAELWAMISDGARWAEWLVDESTVDVRPGAAGTVVDAGRERDVRVGAVEPGRVVTFVWGSNDGSSTSSVELEVVPCGDRAILRVVETFPPTQIVAAGRAAVSWDVRTVTAFACARSSSPALV